MVVKEFRQYTQDNTNERTVEDNPDYDSSLPSDGVEILLHKISWSVGNFRHA